MYLIQSNICSDKFQLLGDLLDIVESLLLEHRLRVKVHYEQALKHNATVEEEFCPLVRNGPSEEDDLKLNEEHFILEISHSRSTIPTASTNPLTYITTQILCLSIAQHKIVLYIIYAGSQFMHAHPTIFS